MRSDAETISASLTEVVRALRGERVLRRRNENTPTAIVERAQSIVDDGWSSTAAPTRPSATLHAIASGELAEQPAACGGSSK
jgi:hypothetical protein